MENYQWQGEPVKVEFGYSLVSEEINKPLWWYNYFVAISPEKLGGVPVATIPAVRVTYGDRSFVLANHHAIAHEKLTRGGWPNMPHSSLPDDSFRPDDSFKMTQHDPKEYAKYQKSSDRWFEKNYGDTKEYQNMKALRDLIKKGS